MGLFGKKREPLEVAVPALARAAFAERGMETTIEFGLTPDDTMLVGADKRVYPLFNLLVICRPEPERRWKALVERHAAAMLAAENDAPAEQLGADLLRARLRTRLVRHFDDDPFPIDVAYARPFAPGLVLALCIDNPEAVATLNSSTVAELAIGLDEAYRVGQANTDGEPIAEHSELGGDIWLVGGESLFIASKAAGFDVVLDRFSGPAPLGVVFAVPQRSLLVYLVPSRPDHVGSIGRMMHVVDRIARDAETTMPGGLLSADLFYRSADGEVERIGGRQPDSQNLAIDATGRFGAVLEALRAEESTGD
ncbi:hypothetical protein ACEXOS_022510 [Herbiconiux sp. P16]|uniref:hypothetical protein n=1 Tax=Herbiconiux wuyangfengii TaxID=3342794 RepID=UPI003CEF5AEA